MTAARSLGSGKRVGTAKVTIAKPPRPRSRERGSVLLAVVLLVAVAAAMSAALLDRAASLAAELRARRDVLCARYAALGGLALGSDTSDAAAAASLVGPRVTALTVARLRLGASWCVRRATARCGVATRSLDHTLADATACDASP